MATRFEFEPGDGLYEEAVDERLRTALFDARIRLSRRIRSMFS
jgi:hypothetical protein